MSKPYIHARSSARRFGGIPEDYMDIHNLMDDSKSSVADVRHRAVFHSAYGIFIVEKMFGATRENADGKTYSVRDIAEQHVLEDLGFIPSLEQWLKDMPIEPWMQGKRAKPNATEIADACVPLPVEPPKAPEQPFRGLPLPDVIGPSILPYPKPARPRPNGIFLD